MLNEESLKLHEKLAGKISMVSKISFSKMKKDKLLELVYTPGVAHVCNTIAKDKNLLSKYTMKSKSVAIISDGTAVLGLGNIGPEAALPVLEGKAMLLKEIAGIDTYPLSVKTNDTKHLIDTIKAVAVTFGAIMLEDVKAPECFEVEEEILKSGIPIMHDDQHGTAMVVYAALINACKVLKKDISKLKIVISGAGAAGTAITLLLLHHNSPFKEIADIIVCDSKGIVNKENDNLNKYKQHLADITNKNKIQGQLKDALKDADIFIGVSKGNILTKEMIQSMNKDPIIFAMANPTPEVDPKLALEAGVGIIATGRSDFPNQINNVLIYPGFFKGLLEGKNKDVTIEKKIAAAKALAKIVKKPSREKILPSIFDKKVVKEVSLAVMKS